MPRPAQPLDFIPKEYYGLLALQLWGPTQVKRVLAPEYAIKYHTECWLRTDKSQQTYSQVVFTPPGGKQRRMLANRLAWLLYHREDPGEKMACHRCDRPKCVNPKHLYLGTQKQNLDDAMHRGRFNVKDLHTIIKILLVRSYCRRARKSGKISIIGTSRQFGISYHMAHKVIKKPKYCSLVFEQALAYHRSRRLGLAYQDEETWLNEQLGSY